MHDALDELASSAMSDARPAGQPAGPLPAWILHVGPVSHPMAGVADGVAFLPLCSPSLTPAGGCNIKQFEVDCGCRINLDDTTREVHTDCMLGLWCSSGEWDTTGGDGEMGAALAQ